MEKLFVHLSPQDHQNDNRIVRKARHRYERPLVLHADMNIKHHRAHGQSMLIIIFILFNKNCFFSSLLKMKLNHQKKYTQEFFLIC